MGTKFPFGEMKESWRRTWWLHSADVLNATELHAYAGKFNVTHRLSQVCKRQGITGRPVPDEMEPSKLCFAHTAAAAACLLCPCCPGAFRSSSLQSMLSPRRQVGLWEESPPFCPVSLRARP